MGEGFLGFRRQTVTHLQTGATTTTEFGRTDEPFGVRALPYSRVPTRTESNVTVEPGITRRRVIEHFHDVATAPGMYTIEYGKLTPLVSNARLRRMTDVTEETRFGKTTVLGSIETRFDYDLYHNATKVTVRSNLARTTTVINRTYRNDSVRWILGLPERLAITSSIDDAVSISPNSASVTRTTSYETDPTTGLVTKVITEPEGGPDVRKIQVLRYDPAGLLISDIETDGAGRTRRTDTGWDEIDRTFPAHVTDPHGNLRRFTYHSGLGKPPLVATIHSSVVYDRLGRPTTVTGANGAITKTSYRGLRAATTDALGDQKDTELDELGRVVQIIERNGVGGKWTPGGPVLTKGEVTTAYSYAAFGQLAHITDPKGNITKFVYDVRGRLVTHQDGDSGVTMNSYDAFDQLVSSTDALGRQTVFAHDALGRVSGEKSTDGVACLRYDVGAGAIGRLSSSTYTQKLADGTSITTNQTTDYDALGRPVVFRQKVGETPAARVTYSYDGFGRLSAIDYPAHDDGGFGVRYAYTGNGYVKSVSRMTGELLWKQDSETKLGQLEQETFGNGVVSRHLYDSFGRPKSVATRFASTVLESQEYAFRADGLLGQRTTTLGSAAPTTESFGYDSMKRVTRWEGSFGVVTYGWDQLGNLTDKSTSPKGGKVVHASYEPGGKAGTPLHAIAESSADGKYTYDAAGEELTGPGERKTSWTAFHLPSKIEVGEASATFAYDASKVRVLKKSSPTGETTTYVAGGLYERRTAGATTTHVYTVTVAGRAVAQVIPERRPDESGHLVSSLNVTYLHGDHLGSPTMATGDAGVVLWRTRFDPFGLRVDPIDPLKPTTAPSKLNVGFTGHEQDEDLELTNMRGRLYDARTARFLSPDPVGSMSGSQALNRYAYAGGNPVNLTDATGHDYYNEGGSSVGGNPFALGLGLAYWLYNSLLRPSSGSGPTNGSIIPGPSSMLGLSYQPLTLHPYSEVGTARLITGHNYEGGTRVGFGPRFGDYGRSVPAPVDGVTAFRTMVRNGPNYEMYRLMAKRNAEAAQFGFKYIEVGMAVMTVATAGVASPITGPAIRAVDAVAEGVGEAASEGAGEVLVETAGEGLAEAAGEGAVEGISAETAGSIEYGALDAFGRPTEVRAILTRDIIEGGTDAAQRLKPPGWPVQAKQYATDYDVARGHLLGKHLGGSGSEAGNIVTLDHPGANQFMFRAVEKETASAVMEGQVVKYTVTPIYQGALPIPRGITIIAQGSGGFRRSMTILNPAFRFNF